MQTNFVVSSAMLCNVRRVVAEGILMDIGDGDERPLHSRRGVVLNFSTPSRSDCVQELGAQDRVLLAQPMSAHPVSQEAYLGTRYPRPPEDSRPRILLSRISNPATRIRLRHPSARSGVGIRLVWAPPR